MKEQEIGAVFYGGSGGVVSGDDSSGFMTEADFTSPTQIPLTGVYSPITAIKP